MCGRLTSACLRTAACSSSSSADSSDCTRRCESSRGGQRRHRADRTRRPGSRPVFGRVKAQPERLELRIRDLRLQPRYPGSNNSPADRRGMPVVTCQIAAKYRPRPSTLFGPPCAVTLRKLRSRCRSYPATGRKTIVACSFCAHCLSRLLMARSVRPCDAPSCHRRSSTHSVA